MAVLCLKFLVFSWYMFAILKQIAWMSFIRTWWAEWVERLLVLKFHSSLPWKLSWFFATACFPTCSPGTSRHGYITGAGDRIHNRTAGNYLSLYKQGFINSLDSFISFLKTQISLERTLFYCSPPDNSVLHISYGPVFMPQDAIFVSG